MQPTCLSIAKKPGLVLLLLVLFGAAIGIPGIDSTTIHREQELRVVLVARNMAQGGDWIIPNYQGLPRLRKPPLMYWAVAAAFKLADNTRDLFAARLPSALSTIAMSLALFFCGRTWVGRRRALLAALLLPTTMIVVRQGRLSETNMMLGFFTFVATWAGYQAMRLPKVTLWWLVAGLAAGLGFMTKGPAAIVLPVLAWLSFAWAHRPARASLRTRRVIPGLLLFLLLASSWYIAVAMHSGVQDAAGDQIEKELVTVSAESRHQGAFYYYIVALFHALAPWGILTPFAVARIRRFGWQHRGIRFLTVWLASSIALLSALSSKQIHYTTLLAPQVLLLAAWYLGGVGRMQRKVSLIFTRTLAVLVAVAGIAIVVLPHFQPTWPVAPCIMAGCASLALGATGLRLRRMATASRVVLLSLGLGIIVAWYSLFIDPILDKYAVIPDIFARNAQVMTQAPHITQGGAQTSLIDFYSPAPVQHFASPDEAWNAAATGDLVIANFTSRHPKEQAWHGRDAIDHIERRDYAIGLYRRE